MFGHATVYDRKLADFPCPLRSSTSYFSPGSSIGQSAEPKAAFLSIVSRKIRVHAGHVGIVILRMPQETNEKHQTLIFDTVLVGFFVFCQTPLIFNRRRTRKLQTSYKNNKNHDILAVTLRLLYAELGIEKKNIK